MDAERIIVALDLDGASHTAIARVFHVDRKTIRRVIKRRLNVPLSPHVQREERSVLVAEQQPEFIAEVREMHKSLAAMVADVRLAVTELGAAFPHDAAPPVLAPVIDLAAYRQRKEVA